MSHFITARTAASRAKFSLLLLGTLAGIVAAGPAGADPGDAPRIAVKYSLQSLASDGGAQDLYRRIRHAARQVCAQGTVRDFSAQRQAEQCRDEAVARAIRQIDNARLAALYATRSKNG